MRTHPPGTELSRRHRTEAGRHEEECAAYLLLADGVRRLAASGGGHGPPRARTPSSFPLRHGQGGHGEASVGPGRAGSVHSREWGRASAGGGVRAVLVRVGSASGGSGGGARGSPSASLRERRDAGDMAKRDACSQSRPGVAEVQRRLETIAALESKARTGAQLSSLAVTGNQIAQGSTGADTPLRMQGAAEWP